MRTLKAALILMLAATAAGAQGVIRLKTRDLVPSVGTNPAYPVASPAFARRHYLLLFGSSPSPEVIAELQARRIVVLAYVPDNALMVSATKLNLRGLDIQWFGPMDPADKVSPSVSSQPWGSYLVIWHADTEIDNDATLAENLGFTVTSNSQLLAGQLLVSGAYSALPSLAALDQVAYILPASAELQNGDAIAGCPGSLHAARSGAPICEGEWRLDERCQRAGGAGLLLRIGHSESAGKPGPQRDRAGFRGMDASRQHQHLSGSAARMWLAPSTFCLPVTRTETPIRSLAPEA